MKTHFRVLVEEKYSKWVDVFSESQEEARQEIKAMEECGEIEIDVEKDFDKWEILKVDTFPLTPDEQKTVEDWARDTVRVTEIVDSDWVLETMTEYECLDWFEQLRDRGITVPELATSCDLWDAVQKERGKAQK